MARQIIGTTVIGGMLAATIFGTFLIPALFYVVERLSGAAKERTETVPPHGIATHTEGE